MLPCVAVVGATCTGKSGLAIALARRFDGELINADALQVYRGFDIGTAKPTPTERGAAPHHLFDILDPEETYSAGEFARRARVVAADIRARNRLPIVVGGSGLYLRALFEGLNEIPKVSDAARARLAARLHEAGVEDLHDELRRRDPDTAGRLHRRDRQRIVRALEVLEETGRTLSSWQRQPSAEPILEGVRVGLTLPRALLYDRIAARTRQMLRLGWLEEVERLLAAGVSTNAPAFQAIGYRQVLAHLRGHQSLEEATEGIIRDTRRYAKRQETWFRKERVAAWFPASVPHVLVTDVMNFLRREIEG